jgi:hypothetical protein
VTIICELKNGMGLGNQLWNIASTRAIAQRLGVDHYCLGYQNFKGAEFLSIPLNEKLNVDTKQIESIGEKTFYLKGYDFSGCLFTKSFFDLASDKVYQLYGLFQDERYIAHSDLNIEYVGKTDYELDKNILVCNVRGGEYRLHKNFQLRKSYWANAISFMKSRFPEIQKIVAVSDDHQYCEKLGLFDQIVAGSIEECFYVLMKAELIICSNSTFSYFPVRLNKNLRSVLAPAFFNRPHQSTLWLSPQNFYEQYIYMDHSGTILDHSKIKHTIEHTERYISQHCELVEFHKLKIPSTFRGQAKAKMPKFLKNRIKAVITTLRGL